MCTLYLSRILWCITIRFGWRRWQFPLRFLCIHIQIVRKSWKYAQNQRNENAWDELKFRLLREKCHEIQSHLLYLVHVQCPKTNKILSLKDTNIYIIFPLKHCLHYDHFVQIKSLLRYWLVANRMKMLHNTGAAACPFLPSSRNDFIRWISHRPSPFDLMIVSWKLFWLGNVQLCKMAQKHAKTFEYTTN